MIGAISKVLLISDDEESRAAIGRMLKREHLAPMVAADAQTGLEQAFSARADVLLLDLCRPSTANMELCKQLRASRIRTPIVVLSGIEEETEKVLLRRVEFRHSRPLREVTVGSSATLTAADAPSQPSRVRRPQFDRRNAALDRV